MNTQIYQGPTITYIASRTIQDQYEKASKKLMEDIPFIRDINSVNSFQELFPRFSEPNFHTDFITFDIEELYRVEDANAYELLKTLRTLINCTVRRGPNGKMIKRSTKLICSVGDTTPIHMVKDVMKLVDRMTIRVGNSCTYEEVRDDVSAFVRGDTSMPKQILDMLRPKKVKTIRLNRRPGEIHLTPRQRQIFDLISTRGASNKAIAKLLDISESTVKLHTSAILKKYGVKNRTQLAVFSRAKEKDYV